MMRSLRARLLTAVLVLTAVGLLVLGGVTYFTQRSFQLQRVDDQARAAQPAVARELGGRRDPQPDRDGPPRGVGPPAGTYGEHRNAAGQVTERTTLDPAEQGLVADPALPRDVPLDELFTVDGENGDTNHYRVLAERDPFAGNASVLETYISYLRHKIDDVDPPLIHTVRGVGYSLRKP